MIDLHCHSHFSDGTLSPDELIQKALKLPLQCMSLTDHDTIAGYPELLAASALTPIKIIQGIELSTRWKKYDIHILGYNIQATDELNQLITKQNESRIQRAQEIGALLRLSGVTDAYQKACVIAGHHRVGRPHFAQLLINEGKTRDMNSAFKQFLGRGKMAYVPTPWISVQEAVEVIVHSGGRASIAHPLKYGLTRTKLHELIIEFRSAGGEGLEVVSGEMTVTQIKEMAATCMRFNLLASSGSDFHSDAGSRVNLGRQPKLPANCKPIWHDWNIEQGTL